MGRSSRKENKKTQKGTKLRHPKKSKFSVHNINSIRQPLNPPPGSGCPTSYIYGDNATKARKLKKLEKGRKKNNKKGFVARKRGKRLFIARFPVVGPGSTKVPWLLGKSLPRGEKKKNQQGGKQQTRKILNGAFCVNESTLNFLNAELEFFSDYVRLSRHEKMAREHMIHQIKKSCKNLFGVDDSQCQVFGSFAAQPVCIFDSDIDLAIWGVVEPDDDEEEGDDNNQLKRHLVMKGDKLTAEDDPNDKSRKKQERVLKWKALIDDAAKNERKDKDLLERVSADLATEKICGEGSAKSPLFVLDRTGDTPSKSSDEICDSPLDDTTLRPRFVNNVQNDCNSDESFSDSKENHNSDYDSKSESTDDDSADKLENYFPHQCHNNPEVETNNLEARSDPVSRENHHGNFDCNDHNKNDEEMIHNDGAVKQRPRGQSLVSLSSSTTCSVEAKLDESEMEVSFVVEGNKHKMRDKLGPSGRTRTLVVRSLFKLTRSLRSLSSQIHVRSKARVPIINMVSNFGFECDIALGGHNGTDTSSYASTQLSRFKR
ncbi:unnamed protein product [Pseudo-nitzschia multistriata]|uniref:Polymerase nucleotidyl transferase domain-containing protein n=1 Tax=Pseudo-nitzschia multistriata TaxID=183589 RepID=A0A448ZJZ9_9STRA|nr:unnamed protein product [Pseudo-nitzschia multistriata]